MIKIFISHASEDKAEFVRPLVSEISKLYDVWYDEFNLNLGDSLLQSIQKGLIESDYGLVVLSPNFFKKHWTQAELDGLFSLEIATGKKIIPIWHQLTFEDVAKESPILAGRLAANSSAGISTIARQIESVVSSDRAHHLQKPAYQIVRKSMRSRNEFLEDDGSRMLHSHECEIQALVDGVTSYTEQLQADGEISEINIDSGQILNCRNEESIIYLESSFEQPLKRGDSVKRTVSCIYNDSFLNDSEYWVIRPSNPTQDIEVQFIFPISRPPKKWGTIVRKLNYEEPSMYNAQKEILPDGRTTLLWQLPELGAQSSYKLTWEW